MPDKVFYSVFTHFGQGLTTIYGALRILTVQNWIQNPYYILTFCPLDRSMFNKAIRCLHKDEQNRIFKAPWYWSLSRHVTHRPGHLNALWGRYGVVKLNAGSDLAVSHGSLVPWPMAGCFTARGRPENHLHPALTALPVYPFDLS